MGILAYLPHILLFSIWKTCQRSLLIQFLYGLAFYLRIGPHDTHSGDKLNVLQHIRVFETYGLPTTSLSITPWHAGINVPVDMGYYNFVKYDGSFLSY